MSSEPIINLIRREIGRFMAQQARPKVGFVTGWNPKTHSAKLRMVPGTDKHPDGTPTGWVPVTVGGAGSGHGDMVALTLGDQVEVTHQGGDPEVPRVTGRIHSDTAYPPVLEEGEMLRRHKLGAELRQDKNGEIWMRQGGATVCIKKDGTVYIDTDRIVYLGCKPGDASAIVMTVSGPSKNVKAAI